MNQYVYPPNDGGKLGIYYRLKCLSTKFNMHLVIFNTENVNVENDDFRWAKNVMVVPRLKKPRYMCNSSELIKQFISWGISRMPRQSYILNSNDVRRKIKAYIIENNINIVLLETPFSYVAVDFCFLKKRNIRLVTVFHNVENIYFQETSSWPRWLSCFEKKRIEALEKIVLKNSSMSICVSPYDAEWYKSTFGIKNIKYLPSVLPQTSKTWKNSKTQYIIFFSQLSFPPNYYGLIWFLENVFSKYSDKYPDVKLKITGRISNDRERIIKKYNKNIEMTGFLKDNDFKALLENALFSIVPVKHGSGVKIKLLEALSCGMPSITTKHCYDGIRFDAVKGKEPFAVADNADDFLKYMYDFTENSCIRERMSANGYDFYIKTYGSQDNIDNWTKNIFGEENT